MADEEEVEVVADPPKSSKLKWVIIGVAALVVIGGGAGAAFFFMPGGESEAAADTDPSEMVGPKKSEPIFVAMVPPFTVNFQGNSRARFLQIAVQAMTRDPKVKETLEKHMPVIRNDLVMLFSSKTASELKSREGKEQLQSETLAGVRRIISQDAPPESVEAVYFTSFVMQ